MKVIKLLPFFLFAIITGAYGQYYANQNKVWAWGINAGVDFSTGSPVSFSTSINTPEGTTSVSDATGNLLFYTDGTKVYDRTGAVMPGVGTSITGLGTNSTTQATVSVQMPGSASLYYVFALEQLNFSTTGGVDCRLRYCRVDMSAAGGFGDIVPSSIGYLDSFLSEKMIAIPGSNCDIWLLVHKKVAAEFRAYRITSAGITGPVISSVGSLTNYGMGVMKISPNRKKLAVEVSGGTTPGTGSELYDFDPATGVVSSCQQLSTNMCYGAEFSPDNTKLYVFQDGSLPLDVCQYDITLPTTAAIVASRTVVGGGYQFPSDMRLGPDGKIYMNGLNSPFFLDRINNPNYAGTACMFFGYAVSLFPGHVQNGLPNVFVTPGLAPITGPNAVCVPNTVTLSCPTAGGSWSSSNTAVATVTTAGVVTGVSAGTAIISYSILGCGTSTHLMQVDLYGLSISGTSVICIGTPSTLSHPLSSGGGTWVSSAPGVASVGASTGVVSGVSAGTANITFIPLSGCMSPPFPVTVDVAPNAGTISGPSNVCLSANISLTSSVTGGTWSSSDLTIASVTSTGVVSGLGAGTATISYSVTNSCGTDVATKVITVGALSTPIAGNFNVCVGSITTLTNATPGGAWNSNNISVAPVVTFVTGEGIVSALAPGVATITYTIGSGCARVATLTVYPFPDVAPITGDSAVCINEAITLSNTTLTGTWSAQNSNATIVPAGIGTAAVTGINPGTDSIFYTVSNPACTTKVNKVITVYPIPDSGIISGTNTVCKNAVITLSESVGGGTWSSGNSSIASIDNTGVVTTTGVGEAIITYSVGPNAAGCSNFTIFLIKVLLDGAFIVKGDLTQIKCYGDNNGSINAYLAGNLVGPYHYLWDNGDTTATLNNLLPGTFHIKAIDQGTQCAAENSFVIHQPDSLSITDSIIKDVCRTGNGSIQVTVTGGTPPYSYLWSNNGISNEITGLLAGNYTVKVNDNNNCKKELAFIVENDNCSDVVIPDVITPNGDGVNDTWVLEGLQYYPANTVQIFDKWGDRVYDKTTYYNEWQGQNKNGNLLPDGTYYYIVKLNAPNPTGGKTEMAGYVLIKR